MNKLFKKLALLLPLAALAACWHEGQKECESYVTFTYLYNFPGVEMFHKSVSKVDLLLFDDNGLYQGRITSAATRAGGNYLPQGYTVTLPRDVASTKRIVTLGGDYGLAFELTPGLVVGQTRVEDINLRVKDNGEAAGSMPGVFLGGRLEDDALKGLPVIPGMPVALEYLNEVHEVELMKISKTFRIALKVTENGVIQPGSDYEFEITAPNPILDLNAEPVDPSPYTYKPYLVQENASGTRYTAAQIWTPRLKSDASQTITIKEKAAPYTVAFQEDLNELIAVMMLQEEGASVSDIQEYMDRKDVYSIVLVLEKITDPSGNRYLSTEITVNDWIVREEIVEP